MIPYKYIYKYINIHAYLFPDALGIKARLDEPGAGVVVQIEVVGRHADDGPVLGVHLLGHGVHGAIVGIVHAPEIGPCYIFVMGQKWVGHD